MSKYSDVAKSAKLGSILMLLTVQTQVRTAGLGITCAGTTAQRQSSPTTRPAPGEVPPVTGTAPGITAGLLSLPPLLTLANGPLGFTAHTPALALSVGFCIWDLPG